MIELVVFLLNMVMRHFHEFLEFSEISYIQFLQVVELATEIVRQEPQVLRLQGRFAVVSDTHGDFPSLYRLLLSIWRRADGTYDMSTKILLLGDYVDRGSQNLRVVAALCSLKALCPDRIFLLRGNHESRPVNHSYGFYEECQEVYKDKARLVWFLTNNFFDCLSSAAVLNGKVFCSHAGFGPSMMESLDGINAANKPVMVPKPTVLTDCCWPDPSPTPIAGFFEKNAMRKTSVVFSAKAVETFERKHGLELVCRGHQEVVDGLEFFAGKRLITLFSSSSKQARPCVLILSETGEIHINQMFGPLDKSEDQPTVAQ